MQHNFGDSLSSMGLDLCHNYALEKTYFERAKVHFACVQTEFWRKCLSFVRSKYDLLCGGLWQRSNPIVQCPRQRSRGHNITQHSCGPLHKLQLIIYLLRETYRSFHRERLLNKSWLSFINNYVQFTNSCVQKFSCYMGARFTAEA